MSRDETRFHLCSVAMVEGALVATDGHRLHMAEDIDSFDKEEVLVDAGTAVALKDAIKQTDADWVMARYLKGNSPTVEFSIEGPLLDVFVVANPVEAKFPPFRQVIPRHSASFEVDSGPLRDSLQTAIKIIKAKGYDPGAKGVEVKVNGDLRLATEAGFREILELSKTADPEFKFGANPVYLVDALRGANGDVSVNYEGTGLGAVSIRADEDLLAVVMPQRT
jgi:DNA polymerase III sliding clamp (beta) subunit (PCNA family)